MSDSEHSIKLADYRVHYGADAEVIVDPDRLDPARYESEKRRIEALVRWLRLWRTARVLDVGCGSGWFADKCATAGATVWATDLSFRGVRDARNRFRKAGCFQVGDVYNLPYADGCFDFVLLSEVLEHLEDIDRAVGEVGRVLRARGRILVSVPNREKIIQHLCIHCNKFTPANAHLHSFDEASLSARLRASGFTQQEQLFLNNKLLELVRFPARSAWLPHRCWQLVDRVFNAATKKPGFLCVMAEKPE